MVELDLSADQQALLEQAKATGRPPIVVPMNGSPVNLSWAKANADAGIPGKRAGWRRPRSVRPDGLACNGVTSSPATGRKRAAPALENARRSG
ncbi:hypothetical protein [uncultured Sphingomonas sp.]|uniref:hypothetical protein n=1 Tax=uncultured Sphingomonas sp. TaxID=158754 RepID=UPI0025E76B87|nr:hypothetical protein [uncultured Sphingomonas sp.]